MKQIGDTCALYLAGGVGVPGAVRSAGGPGAGPGEGAGKGVGAGRSRRTWSKEHEGAGGSYLILGPMGHSKVQRPPGRSSEQ